MRPQLSSGVFLALLLTSWSARADLIMSPPPPCAQRQPGDRCGPLGMTCAQDGSVCRPDPARACLLDRSCGPDACHTLTAQASCDGTSGCGWVPKLECLRATPFAVPMQPGEVTAPAIPAPASPASAPAPTVTPVTPVTPADVVAEQVIGGNCAQTPTMSGWMVLALALVRRAHRRR